MGQILIDKTNMTPARILVLYICLGAVLTAFGLYEPLVKLAGTGATIPISGFGYSLSKGAMEAVKAKGWMGAFTGGLTAVSAGLAAAIFSGYIIALIFKPKKK